MDIVIVEDEILLGLLLADALTDVGHRVLGPASCRAEALGLVSDRTPHLALVDIELRDGESGTGLAGRLRRPGLLACSRRDSLSERARIASWRWGSSKNRTTRRRSSRSCAISRRFMPGSGRQACLGGWSCSVRTPCRFRSASSTPRRLRWSPAQARGPLVPRLRRQPFRPRSRRKRSNALATPAFLKP